MTTRTSADDTNILETICMGSKLFRMSLKRLQIGYERLHEVDRRSTTRLLQRLLDDEIEQLLKGVLLFNNRMLVSLGLQFNGRNLSLVMNYMSSTWCVRDVSCEGCRRMVEFFVMVGSSPWQKIVSPNFNITNLKYCNFFG